MHSFKDLSEKFSNYFNRDFFPSEPENLYNAARHILSIGGKRVRPVLVLMGNELFAEIDEDAYHAAAAIELFHNFSLIHDDIMDKAPLRRGHQTVHKIFGDNTAILAGDVTLVEAYQYLSRVKENYLPKLLSVFNATAKLVCEGQQMDMDFEQEKFVSLEEYANMIELKTSVLLAASLQMGAIIGGAGQGNQDHIYTFGKNLGMAFQVQDDYLDVFGNPEVFGKQPGGDILANKKTFLQIHALKEAADADRKTLEHWMQTNPEDGAEKIQTVTEIFKRTGVDEWAEKLKEQYYTDALKALDQIAVTSSRKIQLFELSKFLLQREQ